MILQVLWALEPEVAPKEQVVDGCLRKERSRFVLLLCVEDFSEITENVDVDIDQAEDTMSILNKYVDGLTLPVESDKIKTVLRDVYNEALSMETA